MENKSEAKLAYEEKREVRKRSRENQGKKDGDSKTSKIILKFIILIIILVLLFIGGKAIVKKNSPQGKDLSSSFPSLGRNHVAVGSPSIEYNSNPPSSGPHYPSPARTGFYDEPLEDRFAIHNLEHGDIWITYKSEVSEKSLKILESFADTFVIVTPRETNTTDIALVAWGKTDIFNEEELTEQRVQDFILRYDNKGPEQVRGVRRGAAN